MQCVEQTLYERARTRRRPGCRPGYLRHEHVSYLGKKSTKYRIFNPIHDNPVLIMQIMSSFCDIYHFGVLKMQSLVLVDLSAS